jgi:hypothetical protein
MQDYHSVHDKFTPLMAAASVYLWAYFLAVAKEFAPLGNHLGPLCLARPQLLVRRSLLLCDWR